MTALRCTQKLLKAMKVVPSVPSEPGVNRLGDWSLNLLHTRPKRVVAVSEHDRLGLVLEAAPFATLPQRFIEAVLGQLLAIGVPSEEARRECDAMQPLTVTATTPYPNRLSLQANLKDYAWIAEIFMNEQGASLAAINARLADNPVSINGNLECPREFVLRRLAGQKMEQQGRTSIAGTTNRKRTEKMQNPEQPLNLDEIEELDEFFLSEDMPENTMDVSTLDGFFASIVLHPKLIMPREYLRWIWDEEKGEDEPAFASLDEANRILSLIMRHYNSVVEAINHDQFEPLFGILHQEDGSEFFDAEGWCCGFMLGAAVFNEPWGAVFKSRPELVAPMVLLGTEQGWDLLEKSGDGKRNTQEAYEAIAGSVVLLNDYFREPREQEIAKRMAKPGKSLSDVVDMPNARFKVGRNESCPCGSGKKFKKCCGAPGTLH